MCVPVSSVVTLEIGVVLTGVQSYRRISWRDVRTPTCPRLEVERVDNNEVVEKQFDGWDHPFLCGVVKQTKLDGLEQVDEWVDERMEK